MSFPTIEDVRAAAEVIRGAVERTPTHHSRTLSKLAGCEIYLKFENLQFTSSFKERGAVNKLMSLTAEQRRRGVVAMSAGNHAQAVAYHGGRLGIPVTIVMPEGSPFVKVKRTRAFGADVVFFGETLNEGYARAKEYVDRDGMTSACIPTTIRRSWLGLARWRWNCWRTSRRSTRLWSPSAAAV